jgi:LysM repeat protein
MASASVTCPLSPVTCVSGRDTISTSRGPRRRQPLLILAALLLLVAPAVGALIVWLVWQTSTVLTPNTTTVIVEVSRPTPTPQPSAVLPPFLAPPTATLGKPAAPVETSPPVTGTPASIGQPVALGPATGGNPQAPATPLPAASPASGLPQIVYVVEAGDTVARIATRYGVQPESIVQANGFTDPARPLRIGERLILPGATGTPVATVATVRSEPPTRRPTPAARVNGHRVHVVEEGDSLGGIADEYDVTLDALLRANGFDDPDGVLRIGERVVIPDANTP